MVIRKTDVTFHVLSEYCASSFPIVLEHDPFFKRKKMDVEFEHYSTELKYSTNIFLNFLPVKTVKYLLTFENLYPSFFFAIVARNFCVTISWVIAYL